MLAALWLMFIIAPALVGARLLAVAGDTPHKGWAVGIWVVGYLAQFLVFRAHVSPLTAAGRARLGDRLDDPVGRRLDRRRSRGGPWRCARRSSSPTRPGWCSAVYRVDRLRAAGLRGCAVVLEVIRPTLNVVVNKDSARRALRVSVERADGTAAYETRLTATFALGDMPEAGDRLAVLIDPADSRHVEPVAESPSSAPHRLPEDLDAESAAQLRRFATMRDRGDLTDAEFATAKKRLLNQ